MILTICGSARFERAMKYWNEVLSLDGHVVFTLAVFPSDKGGNKDWYSPKQKETLDRVHKLKIDASEAVFVVTRELGQYVAYIGESTKNEIEHAANKKVIYDFQCCGYRGCPRRLGRLPPCPLCYE